MEGDTPQVPVTPEVQFKVKSISQTSQQPPADSQTLSKPTLPTKLKKWLKTKISHPRRVSLRLIIILIVLIALSMGGFFVWKNFVSETEKTKEEKKELTWPDEFKTREEYKKYKQENPEKWEIWCEENPKTCEKYEKPHEELEEYKKTFIPDIDHYGDLIIDGTETMVIENKKYLQQGNVYIDPGAKLIIKNSQFMLGRGDIPTIHANIIVGGELEVDNSSIFPEPGTDKKMGSLVVVSTGKGGKVNIKDSPTKIHLLVVSDGAEVILTNSEMIFDIGGLLQIHGGKTKLVNSTIGAIGLTVPANAHLNINGLKSGDCFELWDVRDMIPEANYDIVLENSCILKDDFTGSLKHGPYERGWQFFLDPTSHVKISNSELRKVFIDLVNENVRFKNLKIGQPSSLKYRDIELNDITMMGQWPFSMMDSDVTIVNSDYLFLQPSGESNIYLIDSHMVEFIPREFFGTINFENSLWTNAGEIIGGERGHAMENDFTITGSLKIYPELRQHLQWKDAQVTREYEVIVSDNIGNPIQGALVKINDEATTTDIAGKAKFNLILNEFNYNKPHILEIYQEDELIAQEEVDFFADTPIVVGQK